MIFCIILYVKKSASHISVDVISVLMSCIYCLCDHMCAIYSNFNAMHGDAIKILWEEIMTRNVFITFDTFEVGLVVLNFFFFFFVVHSPLLGSQYRCIFDVDHWEKLRREGKTDKRNEWKGEGEYREMCNLYFASKSSYPYTVHLHEACSSHLLLLLARK